MANTILVSDVIKKDASLYFSEYSKAAATMDKQYSDNFNGTGDTIRVKQPQQFNVFDDFDLTGDNLDMKENFKSLTVDIEKTIGLEFGTKECTVDLMDVEKAKAFSDKWIKPKVSRLAGEVDAAVYDKVSKQVNFYVGQYGVAPELADVFEAARVLDQNCAEGDRMAVISPKSYANILSTNSGYFNPNSEIADQYRTGKIGKTVDFDFWKSDQLDTHQNGTAVDTSSTVDANMVEGSNSIDLTGLTSGATITEGTILEIENVYRVAINSKKVKTDLYPVVVTSGGTADGSGDLTVTISQPLYADANEAYKNVNALPIAGASVDIIGNANQVTGKDLYYTDKAISFATIKLNELGTKYCEFSKHDNINMRWSLDADARKGSNINRMDLLCGAEVIVPEWVVAGLSS